MNVVSRKELVRRLRLNGFHGPYNGGRHQFMKKGQFKLRIPNPHGEDISLQLLKLILKQAGITEREWEENN